MAPSSSRPLSVSRSASRSTTSPEISKEGSAARFSCARFSSTLSRSPASIGADLGDEAALQARAHAVVEAVELRRRPGRGHHHLPAAVEQRVDDVLELLLGLLAAHELQIVDQQDVDGAELVLEGHRVLALDGLDELVAEALGRQIEHVGFGRAPLHLPGDGVLQMRLAEPDAGVEVERIEAALLGEHGLGDLDGARHAPCGWPGRRRSCRRCSADRAASPRSR